MKKKMLFMAAIAGLISLGSCVKDDVSGSVEAVRNAKANQLNADANYKNAQAAHEQALAQTEDATRAAQVAYEQARAAYTAAQADHEKALAANQELLNAAQELANKLENESYVAHLEAVLAQYAYTIADNKDAAQGKLNALLNKIQTADALETARVGALITQFQTAYNNWVTAQNTVVEKEVALEIAKVSAEYAAAIREEQLLNDKANLESEQAVLDYIIAEGQTGDTPAQIAAKLAIVNQKINELQLAYQNSAELPAFVKESNNISKPYSDWYKADAKIVADLAVLADPALATTSAAATPKLFTAPAKKGGVDAVWDNMYDTNNIEKASTVKYYASYVYLGAKTSSTATYVASEIEQIANPVNPTLKLTVNFDGKFNNYAIAKAADIKAIKDAIVADSTTIEAAYATAAAATAVTGYSSLGTKDDAPATGSTFTAYANLNAAKTNETTAKAQLSIQTAQLEADLLILAADPTNTTKQGNVDDDLCNIYGDVVLTLPTGVNSYSKASIPYRNNAVGGNTLGSLGPGDPVDYTASQATKAVNDIQKKIDEAIAGLTTGSSTSPGPGDTRAANLAKVEAAKKAVAAAADDLDAYNKATKALTTAEEAYNKAAQALMDVVAVPDKELKAEKVALEAIYAENYEIALAKQKVKVEKLKESIAKWSDVNPIWVDLNGDTATTPDEMIPDPDRVILLAEQALEQAKMDVVEKYALLLAAKKAIEESGIEYEIYDDDEPAEEPSEEPAEEPAEGGEETPAEGEGEAEGGEEA